VGVVGLGLVALNSKEMEAMKLTEKQKAKDAARMLRGEEHFLDFTILEVLANAPTKLVDVKTLYRAVEERVGARRGLATTQILGATIRLVNREHVQTAYVECSDDPIAPRYQITEAGRAALAAEDHP
jgi:DNA-binding PadR family transcriptional regulator